MSELESLDVGTLEKILVVLNDKAMLNDSPIDIYDAIRFFAADVHDSIILEDGEVERVKVFIMKSIISAEGG